MKINESVSPSTFKNMILIIGLFMAFIIWQWVNGKIEELRYEPIFGESHSSRSVTEKIDLRELPIVVAQSLNKTIDSDAANEMAIEAAFQIPVYVDEEELEAEIETTAAQQLFMMYRPAVSAVSPRKGAVISGIYWRLGESIDMMPVQLENGEMATPKLTGVSHNQAVLTIDGGKLSLPFEQF